MRGKIDLTNHKLAGLFRPPAKRTRRYRTKMQKRPDDIYAQLWRLIDGAVRDTFANHPEYLTVQGRQSAAGSIIKRVTGALHGYAAQAAQGRSKAAESFSPRLAADRADAASRPRSPWMRLFKASASWVRAYLTHTRGGDLTSATRNITLLKWACSEEEAMELQGRGWVCDPNQPITRHHKYSILLRKKVDADG